MIPLKFTTVISSPKEKVWDVLWSPESYSKWTEAFGAGSTAKSDWKEGSRVHFLSDKGDACLPTLLKR